MASSAPPVPDPAPWRVVFFGTAELAVASLQALATSEPLSFHVAAVVTQPDRPKGRALHLQPSAVKRLALSLNLPVLQPERCRAPEFVAQLGQMAPDLVVVAAYGQILPPALLAVPRLGCLNVHASLLPRYRGAAPIQWALLDGAEQTGVTIMRMDAGLDTGDILTQESVTLAPEEDAACLHDRLARLGAGLLVRTIPAYAAGRIVPRPQPAEGVSYARKITKEDGHLDWSRPAAELERRLRAFTPWPGAFTFVPAEGRSVLLKVWRGRVVSLPAAVPGAPGTVLHADKRGVAIATGEGVLELTELQREGGRRMPAAEFLAGHSLPVGLVLGG